MKQKKSAGAAAAAADDIFDAGIDQNLPNLDWIDVTQLVGTFKLIELS